MNAAFCNKCETLVRSKYRHDFAPCKCGDIFVDGGEAYRRFGCSPGASWVDITTDELYDLYTNNQEHS